MGPIRWSVANTAQFFFQFKLLPAPVAHWLNTRLVIQSSRVQILHPSLSQSKKMGNNLIRLKKLSYSNLWRHFPGLDLNKVSKIAFNIPHGLFCPVAEQGWQHSSLELPTHADQAAKNFDGHRIHCLVDQDLNDKLLRSEFINFCNKLEFLYLASLSSLF